MSYFRINQFGGCAEVRSNADFAQSYSQYQIEARSWYYTPLESADVREKMLQAERQRKSGEHISLTGLNVVPAGRIFFGQLMLSGPALTAYHLTKTE